ncbi:MAG: UDP-N-acetylmuramate dehydrogenase [Desulfobacterales bacterium]
MALDQYSHEWLVSNLGSSVSFNEPMAKHTSIRIGGPAEAYIVPENLPNLIRLVQWSVKHSISYLIIGNGTNLLVRDGGIKGLVISLARCLNEIKVLEKNPQGVIVCTLAGVAMPSLCNYAIKNGFKGLNFALGIPGTIGGCIAANAGTSHGSVDEVLKAVKVLLPSGKIKILPREQLFFSYRKLTWPQTDGPIHPGSAVILEGHFDLQHSGAQKLRQEADQILQKRRQQQPVGALSTGCVFRNPLKGRTAGELIDRAGLKTKSIGGVTISAKHANFFINTGKATAADFIALVAAARDAVSAKYDVDLEPEVKIVGA